MIAVIKGDIINSRKLADPEIWMAPLKVELEKWAGASPQTWELAWGDYFQLEIADPADAIMAALSIKALIKSIPPENKSKKMSPIDVRMAIGIGNKKYTGKRISESNGEAFIFAGEEFDLLKKNKLTLAVRSPWNDFDKEINLYVKMASSFMDNWSVSSSVLIRAVLENPSATQRELGKTLGIKQNSVSGRWSRANAEIVIELEKMYRHKLSKQLR